MYVKKNSSLKVIQAAVGFRDIIPTSIYNILPLLHILIFALLNHLTKHTLKHNL